MSLLFEKQLDKATFCRYVIIASFIKVLQSRLICRPHPYSNTKLQQWIDQ